MKRKVAVRALAAVLILPCILVPAYHYGRSVWHPVYSRLRGRRTIEEAVARYGPAAEQRLVQHFTDSGLPYPPRHVALIAFKWERTLELWAAGSGDWELVRTHPILGVSGEPGPKLWEGDGQVPEGVYRIDSLNPNSSYHLSFRLNYPNDFDLARAREDGRTDPGSDIFIHGGERSIGCLAMGDEAIEELFTLVARVQLSEVKVLIAPHDLRKWPHQAPPPDAPPWTGSLYGELRQALREFSPRLRPSADCPGFGAIERTAADLVAAKWREEHPGPHSGSETGLQGVSVRMVRRADELLSNASAPVEDEGPWEFTPAYLVNAVARAGWWKNTTKHVLVLRWRDGRCEEMVHCEGGWNGRPVEFEIVDLGGDRSKCALVVADHGCGNQCSQIRTHIFSYNQARDAFDEVFNEQTTWLPSFQSAYDSSMFFPETPGAMRDIFIQTRLWKGPRFVERAAVESVFRFDGQEYVGQLALPPDLFD